MRGLKSIQVVLPVVVLQNIRIYHEYVDRIDNSVLRVTAWRHEAVVMPNSDPRDRIVQRIHKRMLDSFSCILLGARALINPFLPLNALHLLPPS